MEVVAIDFMVLEKSSSGHKNVLIITDIFSKFPVAVRTCNQSAQTVANVVVKHWFNIFGSTARLLSDNSNCFEAKII